MTNAESTRSISLTKGYAVVVDAADYQWLNKWSWYAVPKARTVYAGRTVHHNGKTSRIYMHRAITNANPGEDVDHINSDGLDNRRQNLRKCSRAENLRRTRKARGGSKYKGVSWHTKYGRWRAVITVNKRQRHLGVFADEIEAARAYDRAALKEWGEFARLNFP